MRSYKFSINITLKLGQGLNNKQFDMFNTISKIIMRLVFQLRKVQ